MAVKKPREAMEKGSYLTAQPLGYMKIYNPIEYQKSMWSSESLKSLDS